MILRHCFALLLTALLAPPAVASTPAAPTSADDGPAFPILAWIGVPAEHASVERYRELADAGFTVTFDSAGDLAKITQMLDQARQAGVQIVVSLPELFHAPEETARQLKDHPAMAGYYLRDEPPASAFAELGAWARRIQSVDAVHPCYVNLLPTYGHPEQWGAPTYQDYVERFLAEIPIPLLSFDHYPVVRNGDDPATDALRGDFYQNLEICSAAARESKRPLHAFLLSVAHTPYPIPTLTHLRLQGYSNLAYGAQVLQYFTYWTPTSTTWNFHEAPIAADGARTPTYDVVKAFNAELNALRGVFLGSKVESVGHTGGAIPVGTTAYQPSGPIKSLDTSGTGVAASHLRKGNHRFLVMVNRDIHQPTTAIIEFTDSTPAAQVAHVAKDGAYHPLPAGLFKTTIAPGDVAILSWETERGE